MAAEARAGALTADGEVLAGLELTRDDDRATVLLLHGAGQSRKEKYVPLMEALAARHVGSVIFEFSGHGESTGLIAELSLARRHRQARAMLSHVLHRRRGAPIIVMGFSMSGQTTCDLLAGHGAVDGGDGGDGAGDDLTAAVLCCPAVYASEAYDIPFGQSDFTAVLRRPGSWTGSAAFAALRGYRRPMLIVRPDADEVIPEEISARIAASRPPGLTVEHIVEGASHQLMHWFAQRPDALHDLAGRVAALATG